MERDQSRVSGTTSRQQFVNAVSRFQAKHGLIAASALLLGIGTIWFWSRPESVAQVQAAGVSAEEEVVPAPGKAVAEAEHEREPMLNSLPDNHALAFAIPSDGVPPQSAPAVPVVDPASAVPVEEEAVAIQPVLDATQSPRQKHALSADPVMTETQPHDESKPVEEKAPVGVVAMIAAEAERGWPVAVRDEPQPAMSEPATPIKGADVSTQDAVPEAELPPLLSTLPYRFQSTLPKIVINAQAYADIAEERFVILNMKKYREGERTQEGIVIERIGKELLQLNYQGQQFRVQR